MWFIYEYEYKIEYVKHMRMANGDDSIEREFYFDVDLMKFPSHQVIVVH